MVAPSQLPGRSFQQTTKTSDLLLSWRASDLSLDALSGQAGTFSRASVGGLVQGTGTRKWLDTDNQLRLAGPHPSELERWEWVLDADNVFVPALRLEGPRTNGFTKAEEFDDAAWTKTRSSISADAVVAPDGHTTADKLVEDGTASQTHLIARNTPSLTNDTDSTWSVLAKAAERSEIRLNFVTKAGSVPSVFFDLAAGTVGTEANSASGTIKDFGNGWFRCTISADMESGGSTPSVGLRLSSGSETTTYNGDGASGCYVWGSSFETDESFPSTYIRTAASTVTRAVETLFWAYSAVPQAQTIYMKFVYAQAGGGARRIMHIGNATVGDGPRITITDNSATFALDHENATATVSSALTVTQTIGEVIELRGLLNANGSVQIGLSVDGGAESLSVASAANALAAAWVAERFYPNSAGATNVSFNSYLETKVAAGIRTMEYMRQTL